MVAAWGCAGLVAMLFAALHRRRDPASARPLFRDREPRRRRDAARDRQHHARSHRRRHGPQPADPAASRSARRRSSSSAPCLALAVAATAAAILVQHSKLGFGLRCIQQNEDAANMLGVNAYAYKTAAFMLSAVFVGIAGAIYASWVNYIEPPDVFDILLASSRWSWCCSAASARSSARSSARVFLIASRSSSGATSSRCTRRRSASSSSLLVLFLPNGLLSLLRDWLGRRRAPA